MAEGRSVEISLPLQRSAIDPEGDARRFNLLPTHPHDWQCR